MHAPPLTDHTINTVRHLQCSHEYKSLVLILTHELPDAALLSLRKSSDGGLRKDVTLRSQESTSDVSTIITRKMIETERREPSEQSFRFCE